MKEDGTKEPSKTIVVINLNGNSKQDEVYVLDLITFIQILIND